MRKLLVLISIIFLVIAAIRLGLAIQQHNIWSITPIYEYNIPHGIVGWSLVISVVTFAISRFMKKK